jgi:hypothetical protein
MALSDWESAMRTDMNSFPIGGVLVAVVVLGYAVGSATQYGRNQAASIAIERH